jgi:hypothetical protein
VTDEDVDDPEDDDTDPSFTTCDVCDVEEDSDEVDEEWVLLSAGNSRLFFVYICPECAQSKENLQKGIDLFVDGLPEAMQGERS